MHISLPPGLTSACAKQPKSMVFHDNNIRRSCQCRVLFLVTWAGLNSAIVPLKVNVVMLVSNPGLFSSVLRAEEGYSYGHTT